MRVLTWNLFHGRSLPASQQELSQHFAAALASWEWDAALLQEVPPWWPASLALAAGAQQRTALTSRNSALALRRALAQRWPELAKSNGGGANAVLARAEQRVDELTAQMQADAGGSKKRTNAPAPQADTPDEESPF